MTKGVAVGVVVGLNDGPRLGPDDGSPDDGFTVGLWGGSRAARGFRNRNSYIEFGSSWYGSSLYGSSTYAFGNGEFGVGLRFGYRGGRTVWFGGNVVVVGHSVGGLRVGNGVLYVGDGTGEVNLLVLLRSFFSLLLCPVALTYPNNNAIRRTQQIASHFFTEVMATIIVMMLNEELFCSLFIF